MSRITTDTPEFGTAFDELLAVRSQHESVRTRRGRFGGRAELRERQHGLRTDMDLVRRGLL